MLIPMPSWDGLHPIITHFPIGLLLIAPVLVVFSLIFRQYARPYAYSALTLMVLGTAAAYIAVETGESAAELVERGGPVDAVLEQHESLAEQTRILFTVITLVYAFIVLAPLVIKSALKPLPWTVVNGAFLAFYLVGALFLANTGHQGGRLVHEFGVRAMVTPMATEAAPSVGAQDDEDDE